MGKTLRLRRRLDQRTTKRLGFEFIARLARLLGRTLDIVHPTDFKDRYSDDYNLILVGDDQSFCYERLDFLEMGYDHCEQWDPVRMVSGHHVTAVRERALS